MHYTTIYHRICARGDQEGHRKDLDHQIVTERGEWLKVLELLTPEQLEKIQVPPTLGEQITAVKEIIKRSRGLWVSVAKCLLKDLEAAEANCRSPEDLGRALQQDFPPEEPGEPLAIGAWRMAAKALVEGKLITFP